MSQADTKETQLMLEFGEEPEEAHIYFIIEAFLDLQEKMGDEVILKAMKDAISRRLQRA